METLEALQAQEAALLARINAINRGSFFGRPEAEPLWKEYWAIHARVLPLLDKRAGDAWWAQEQARRARVEEEGRQWAALLATLPTWRRTKHGWEIVKYGAYYYLRHPRTKEEVYKHWHLQRVREVAGEAPPEETVP